MATPDNSQQVTDAPEEKLEDNSLEDALAVEFDRLESEEETTEELSEEVETTAEEAPEVEATETVAEEAVAEETAEWNEPAGERWPDELKEAYNQLPPEMQQVMMEKVYKPMQRTYTQSTQELSQLKKGLDPMIQSLQQYQNDFDRMGVDPVEAFRTQVAWAAHIARVGPQQGVADMQAAYGQTSMPAGQEVEEYLTPVERSMKAELDTLKQQIGQTSQTQQSWQEQQTHQQNAAYVNGVKSELQSFISEQNDGQPAHPHIEKVAPAIAGILRGGLVNRTDEYGQPTSIRDQMNQAYDMACRLDSSISTAPTNTRQVARAKAAQDAEVVTSVPGGEEVAPKLSVSDYLEEEYDRLSHRVG